MFIAATCVTGPTDLASWIQDKYRTVLSTLDGVAGFHDFYLRKLTDADGECTFVSLTTWDGIQDFRDWRHGPGFMSAERACVDWEKFSRLRPPRRYDYHLDCASVGLGEIDAMVRASLVKSGHAPAASAGHFEAVLSHTRRPLTGEIDPIGGYQFMT